MDIEKYLINQIRENLRWLVENTDMAWDVVEQGPDRKGLRFVDSVDVYDTIWDDEA